jgi:hypothetical protein
MRVRTRFDRAIIMFIAQLSHARSVQVEGAGTTCTWDEYLILEQDAEARSLLIEVWNENVMQDELMGQVST